MDKLATAWAIFQGLLLEAIPFLLLGVAIAGLARWAVPPGAWIHRLPKNPVLAPITGALMGFALPACECGNVPVARRLRASGAPMGTAFGFLFAAPVLNPIVLASTFTHWGIEHDAYRFNQGGGTSYFDVEGGSLQRVFLKAPVEFSRISSRYNPKRFHPVLKKVKGHFGTDYAAPTGTPIVAVGDGVVTISGYTSGNGKYVKIRHNGTYETQYLHMSKRAVKKGQQVRQGEVIGYVGSTGLATGPHVCFRFWKNGQQIDHLREEFPPSDPSDAKYQKDFAKEVNRLEGLKATTPINAGRPASL